MPWLNQQIGNQTLPPSLEFKESRPNKLPHSIFLTSLQLAQGHLKRLVSNHHFKPAFLFSTPPPSPWACRFFLAFCPRVYAICKNSAILWQPLHQMSRTQKGKREHSARPSRWANCRRTRLWNLERNLWPTRTTWNASGGIEATARWWAARIDNLLAWQGVRESAIFATWAASLRSVFFWKSR